MSSDIQKLRRMYQSSIKKVRDERINGIVGRGAKYADVAGPRRNHIWVTIADSEMLIRNTGPGRVLARAGLPVKLIRRFNGDLVLDGNDVSGMLDDDTNAPGDVFFVNDIGPDGHGNVILDSDDIPEGSTNVYYTAERARDDVALALVEGAGIDITVNDAGDTITIASTITAYTDELAQDAVGGMFTGNVETDIAVTYQDATAKVDFVVSPTLVGDRIHAATGKTTPVDADELGLADSAASFALKKLTWANLQATIKSYYDSVATTLTNKTLDSTNISTLTSKTTPVDADSAVIVDSVASNVFKRVTYTNIKAFLKTYFDTLYNLYVHPNHTGDVTSVGDGATTIANDAVTFAKMQNIATDSLIGRDTAGTGDAENILLNATLSMDGSGNLQRAALTGDVTASAGSNATTIAANAVTDTKLRDSALLSVIGRSANSAGDPADIAAVAASGAVLRESGSVLGFGSIATAGITNNAVTSGKIADNAVTNTKLNDMANATVKGRTTAGTGDPEDLTMAQLVALIEVQALYALLAGRVGSQILNGGTAANEDMTIRGTSHATKTTSYVLLQDDGGFVGIGTTAPAFILHIKPSSGAGVMAIEGAVAAVDIIDTGAAVGEKFWQWRSDAGHFRAGLINDAGSAFILQNAINIDASGNVGIGIVPAAQLDVLQPTLGSIVQRLASTATNDDPTEDVVQNRVATTNATVTTLHTFTLANNTTYSFDVWVTARRTAGSGVGAANDGAGVHINGTYKGMTGTATIVGTLTILHQSLDTSMAAVTMDVTGATVRVRVTGTASNSIVWHCVARTYVVSS